MNKDFTKLIVRNTDIVKSLEKCHLVNINGYTVIIAKSLVSKYQDLKQPETTTFSIPVKFDFTARKSEQNEKKQFVVVDEKIIKAVSLQDEYDTALPF